MKRGGFGFWWLIGNIIGRAAPQEHKGFNKETEVHIVVAQAWSSFICIEAITLIVLYFCALVRNHFVPMSGWEQIAWVLRTWVRWPWVIGVVAPCLTLVVRMLREVINPFYQQQHWQTRTLRELQALAAVVPQDVPQENMTMPVMIMDDFDEERLESRLEDRNHEYGL